MNVPQASGNKRDEAKLHAAKSGERRFQQKDPKIISFLRRGLDLTAAREKFGSSINRTDSPKWSRRKFKI